jgi:hypothetical protein
LKDVSKELKAHKSDLRQELRADIKASQGELKQEIRQDIRREISQGQEAIKKDIQADLNQEIMALSKSCATQFQDLQQGMQSAERGIQELKASHSNVETRLQALEARGSDSGTAISGASPGKKPALVLGGWDPDTAAEEMLELAKCFVRELRLDIDVEEMFVPGVRRGFVILPYGTREGESAMQMRQRIQAALSKVRAANTTVPGRTRPVWLVYSRSPAERKRSALAGKVKRLVLQLQGDARGGPSLEVEWGSGTVWLGGRRVASAASAAPPHAGALATGGWLDIAGIAQKLRMTRDRVKGEWEPLASQLR